MRWIWIGATASITAFHHDLSAGGGPDFSQNSKSLVGMSGCNVVGTHPYAHQQHIMIVKHLIYTWDWCEMNMGWVFSLNHRISPWVIGCGSGSCLVGLDFLLNSKSLVGMSGSYIVGTHPYAHPHYIKVVKHLIYMTLVWDEYGLGLQPQSPHFTITELPGSCPDF